MAISYSIMVGIFIANNLEKMKFKKLDLFVMIVVMVFVFAIGIDIGKFLSK